MVFQNPGFRINRGANMVVGALFEGGHFGNPWPASWEFIIFFFAGAGGEGGGGGLVLLVLRLLNTYFCNQYDECSYGRHYNKLQNLKYWEMYWTNGIAR